MQYQEAKKNLDQLRQKIAGLRGKMRELQADVEPEAVDDYTFQGADGPVRLSELFGDNDHLFVIHNMGRSCPYCTLWADGFNGITHHLQSRAGFVVTSPDSPAEQQAFAVSRDWQFPMVSHAGGSFAADMGYTSDHGYEPGVSVFRRDGDQIVRISDTSFGPDDDFCSMWHFLTLLSEGVKDWTPKNTYA
jgi:predicted dithiol-disulfide oxidoreductase (DUF899 family)